ncbi:hypothetical protein EVAR_26876_1 [Eumeta japonica]|uniref:Uncharacterized protein n=1 Tax=Eumeta variegata TaxID=151549 RepID=A0A4C1VVK4_EUMVA|nr:hypothetical protein EVAR_26876_1 [Eumeta japonica]
MIRTTRLHHRLGCPKSEVNNGPQRRGADLSGADAIKRGAARYYNSRGASVLSYLIQERCFNSGQFTLASGWENIRPNQEGPSGAPAGPAPAPLGRIVPRDDRPRRAGAGKMAPVRCTHHDDGKRRRPRVNTGPAAVALLGRRRE